MRSRMTPEQLAKAKGLASTNNDRNKLATRAAGLGVSRADRERAAAELEKQVGKKKAAQLREDAIRQAGGGRRGLLGRLLG